jgi:hypothetical protein
MPISELYKDRSIVPDALAFPNDGRGRSSGSGVVTFQNELSTNVTNVTTIVQTDTQQVRKSVEAAMSAVSNAEQRAKSWVGEYERVGRWDIQGDVVVSTNTNDPVQFDTENVRIMGAEFVGTRTTAGAKWRYLCPHDAEGIYAVGAMLIYTLPVAMNCPRVRMATFINGVQWSVLDSIDRGYAGENPIQDAKLAGTDLLPLSAGDELTIQTYIAAGSSGDQTLTYPQSVYGRVTLARTRCEFGKDGNGDLLTAPASGNNYLWNN